MGRVTSNRRMMTVRLRDGQLYHSEKPDTVAVEEPLDIRLNGQKLSLTMRTPGHDVELIHGFLHAEGYIQHREDILEARYCDGAVVEDESGFERNTYNVMDFTTAPGVMTRGGHGPVGHPDTTAAGGGADSPMGADGRTILPVVQKTFITSSACGVCGSISIDDVVHRTRYSITDDFTVKPADLLRAQAQLSDGQKVFQRTGGVHAAALITPDGTAEVLREDVGRHNAVDKVIGWSLLNSQMPIRNRVLLVSSRASFEIVQKAAMAGISFVACVSAPSSLAIDTAERFGMTLAGFVRAGRDDDNGRFNVYTGAQRIDLEGTAS
ncbi:formate dehydrogenase accessory sulfurtransferase FdhD [Helcobacillus massiliensis]|uniref:Sulfur carrier protein FdhD n=1 Tax=Helcobacillus massiliensis TaxID=521392 RepID=A0A839QVB5_9MICO|nr:formate dehydrogenase accessory sulfurtransferase FdhD [Helcobacillus massiliensis]MBB3023578.1 FdhD protein [Helcobacillus massiliensis]